MRRYYAFFCLWLMQPVLFAQSDFAFDSLAIAWMDSNYNYRDFFEIKTVMEDRVQDVFIRDGMVTFSDTIISAITAYDPAESVYAVILSGQTAVSGSNVLDLIKTTIFISKDGQYWQGRDLKGLKFRLCQIYTSGNRLVINWFESKNLRNFIGAEWLIKDPSTGQDVFLVE